MVGRVACRAVTETPEPPPTHVCAAFGARATLPEIVDRGPQWRCDDIVLRPVSATTEAAWVAQTLDGLRVDNVRVARPVRSSDGRWVVSGWVAHHFVEGRPEARHDDVVAASLRLHVATAGLYRPKFLDARHDVFALADRASWGEEDVPLTPDRGGRMFSVLAASWRPTRLRPQVVHGDLFGNVLFAGGAPPAIVDFIPYYRPAEWAAAVVIVDSLAWGGADPGILQRWSHLSEWPQMLLRALLYRLAVNALHPKADGHSLTGLETAARHILDVL